MVNIQLDRHLPQRCDLSILLFYFGVFVCAENSNAVGLLCFALDFLFRINLREMLMRRTCAAEQEKKMKKWNMHMVPRLVTYTSCTSIAESQIRREFINKLIIIVHCAVYPFKYLSSSSAYRQLHNQRHSQ